MTTLLDIAHAEITASRYKRMTAAVCSLYGVPVGSLKNRQRARSVARPRQIVMYLATTDLGLATTTVGRLLGGRDHSTVIHGRDTIARMIETNAVMRERVERIRSSANIERSE